MGNGIRVLCLSFTLLVFPLFATAQGQGIDVEVGSYGGCSFYFTPGTEDFRFCLEQQENFDRARVIRFERVNENEEEVPNRFNVIERYYE